MKTIAKPLYESYRPATWQEVVGQDKTVNALLAMKDRAGLAGRAYWISGQSGTGKTTIARLLAAEVADDFFISEIDATDLSASALKQIEDTMLQKIESGYMLTK